MSPKRGATKNFGAKEGEGKNFFLGFRKIDPLTYISLSVNLGTAGKKVHAHFFMCFIRITLIEAG